MNRRDLIAAAFGTAAFVEAAEAMQHDPREQNLSWNPQPKYYVLYQFQFAPVNDFVPIGVYTLREDAEHHQAALAPRNDYERKSAENLKPDGYAVWRGCIVEHTHEELCYHLGDIRMGALAETMREILGVANADNRSIRDNIKYLYGKDGFPYAVALSRK